MKASSSGEAVLKASMLRPVSVEVTFAVSPNGTIERIERRRCVLECEGPGPLTTSPYLTDVTFVFQQ